MNQAKQLIKLYKEKQNQQPVDKFTPILSQLTSALVQIANKPEPVVEVNNEVIPSEVKIDAPIVNIPEFPPFPKMPEVKMDFKSLRLPDNYDYTSLLIELKRSVDKLTQAVANRPKGWDVLRNKSGFIDKVVASNDK